MPFYPSIKDEQVLTLELVVQSLAKDPAYLDNTECPYSDRVKSFFRRSGPAATVAVVDIFEGKEGEEEIMVVDKQLHRIISDLDSMATSMLTAESSDRLNYLKVKTSLLEKLIGMRERVFNLREVSQFRDVIMAGLDAICTKDQITDFMKRLDGVLGTGTNTGSQE